MGYTISNGADIIEADAGNPTGYWEHRSFVSLNRKLLAEAAIIKLAVLNLLNHKYNEYEYITASGYFGGNSAGSILAYPGMPIAAYVTMTLKF